MPETKLKDLHLGTCIDDLDKHYDVSAVKGKRIKLLCNSAKKIYDMAEIERKNGDEELSYVLYMKYIALVREMPAALDYDKKYTNDMIGKQNMDHAFDWAGKLKTSLINRYEKKQALQYREKFASSLENARRQDLRDIQKIHHDHQPPPKESTNPPHDSYDNEISIEPSKLFALLKEDKIKILILDVRSRVDFTTSCMKYPQCINIPEDIITPGIAANKLEKSLPIESIALWSQRKDMDLIVLVDWSSVIMKQGAPLHLMKTILTKWDPQIVYKRPPIFIEGGYEDWLLTYPTYTTNPHVLPQHNDSFPMDILDSIDYPMFLESNSPKDVTVNKQNISLNINNTNPSIDRSSKAAAIQTYDERAKEMKMILEERERITGQTLDIEKQRVIAEENWERLQQNKKKETEEEASVLREQELLSEIMQLESVQRDMSLENQQLREKLEEYMRKEKEESLKKKETSPITPNEKTSIFPTEIITNGTSKTVEQNQIDTKTINDVDKSKTWKVDPETVAKEEKIKNMEQETAALGKKRQIMQLDREKILADAREKKKMLYKKKYEESKENSYGESLEEENKSNSIYNHGKITEMPQFDRTTKPSQNVLAYIEDNRNKQRDFQGVWGNQGQGLTGLKNLGNTCYMNSIIQCLNNTSYLVKYFRDGLYKEHLKKRLMSESDNNGGTHGAVAEEVAAVIQALWSGQYRFISPKDLRSVIGRYRSMFRGVDQQDSHEFLMILMDWLHNDLQITSNPNKNIDNLEPADKAWLEYTKSKESLILNLFYGQIKSTVKCSICGKESITYDSFSNLSLELPTNANRCSLNDCLELYFSHEKIVGWNCPVCKEKRDARKKMDISKLPPILVIHFKRFYIDQKDYMSNSYKKKQTYIDFPVKGLHMDRFSVQPENKNKMYNLYGVSNHYGSMESGHCTAFCKSSVHSKWYKFDDHTVSDISPNDVVSSAAYILFYTSLRECAFE